MSKEDFKLFARRHPELANQVVNNKTTWQKLYEIYEIYGSDSSVWDDYIITNSTRSFSPSPATTFRDFFNTVKNIDLDSVQKGVNNLQKTIGLLQDIGVGGSSVPLRNGYEARPLYRYFED